MLSDSGDVNECPSGGASTALKSTPLALSAQYANSARAWWLGRCWRLGPVASHQ